MRILKVLFILLVFTGFNIPFAYSIGLERLLPSEQVIHRSGGGVTVKKSHPLTGEVWMESHGSIFYRWGEGRRAMTEEDNRVERLNAGNRSKFDAKIRKTLEDTKPEDLIHYDENGYMRRVQQSEGAITTASHEGYGNDAFIERAKSISATAIKQAIESTPSEDLIHSDKNGYVRKIQQPDGTIRMYVEGRYTFVNGEGKNIATKALLEEQQSEAQTAITGKKKKKSGKKSRRKCGAAFGGVKYWGGEGFGG